MNYGFVIDTRSCIGCHACSTACKSENQVPLGVNRTWVKYTETGSYPDVGRNFQVTRCNHCSNPPCVRICPVTAMYQRDDGIVEFDGDQCIGCKACMQACPYDAIYIDPETKTAAKCHYCGHRVENGLEPACVVVCPTHSIIAGDMDDPRSEISRVLAGTPVTVRKPEQGTAPKLFYVQGSDVAMHPTALPRQPQGLSFSDVLDPHGHHPGTDYGDATRYAVHLDLHGERAAERPLHGGSAPKGASIRTPDQQGDPSGGPIQIAPGRMAGQMVQVGYNVHHKVPWHWQVPAYLVTKGIAAGAFLLLAIGVLTSAFPVETPALIGGGLQGVLGILATTALLVADLERPERFLRIVFRPQWKSWLTRGAFLLIGFANVAALWWLAEIAQAMGFIELGGARMVLAALTVPLAVGTAIYTAFLFGQCEGRDLWQNPGLPLHLLVQAVMVGAAALLGLDALLAVGNGLDPAFGEVMRWTFFGAVLVDLFILLFGEFAVAHSSEVAARAAHAISKGPYRRHLWLGAIGLGHLLPILLLLSGVGFLHLLAVGAAIIGLYLYEYAFVMAPQEVPNS